ncbi:hypothetical protein DFH09DRAFT_1396087 [Mycena vulgaris]|nr:hypothetical protein DFH09DRAFT_1445413 [Mycena vulgaris]KAJ6540900.1 hypothetical protein DFH09DRAFT_1396087 [Mycena vulgaris]
MADLQCANGWLHPPNISADGCWSHWGLFLAGGATHQRTANQPLSGADGCRANSLLLQLASRKVFSPLSSAATAVSARIVPTPQRQPNLITCVLHTEGVNDKDKHQDRRLDDGSGTGKETAAQFLCTVGVLAVRECTGSREAVAPGWCGLRGDRGEWAVDASQRFKIVQSIRGRRNNLEETSYSKLQLARADSLGFASTDQYKLPRSLERKIPAIFMLGYLGGGVNLRYEAENAVRVLCEFSDDGVMSR